MVNPEIHNHKIFLDISEISVTNLKILAVFLNYEEIALGFQVLGCDPLARILEKFKNKINSKSF